MGAEASVPYADAELRVSPAATSEWCIPSTVNVANGNVVSSSAGPSSSTPGMAASPERSRCATSRSCPAMARPPERSSSSIAACIAMLPSTFGEPASSRSGGSVQITSSRSTRSTAPPPARNGSPDVNVAGGPTAHPRRTVRTSCGRSTRRSRRWRAADSGEQAGPRRGTRARPGWCAASRSRRSAATSRYVRSAGYREQGGTRLPRRARQ